jgi:hypothetical protein
MHTTCSAVHVGPRMLSAGVLALGVLFGCSDSSGTAGMGAVALAEYPSVEAGFLSALEWRFVGPYRGGRVVAVAGDTRDTLVFYFGAAHGGVWKTTDAGGNWCNVSDDFFAFSAVGALDVSLSHPDVIYAGTGEGLQRQFISSGDGVYKSTDAGKTWTNVGLKETRHISTLRVHPTNPDIVYVAVMGDMFGSNPERGIYRTTDGGDSWTDITRNPGLPTGLIGKIGVAISPARSSRVYAFVEAAAGDDGLPGIDPCRL